MPSKGRRDIELLLRALVFLNSAKKILGQSWVICFKTKHKTLITHETCLGQQFAVSQRSKSPVRSYVLFGGPELDGCCAA